MEKKFQPVSIDLLGRWVFEGLQRDEVMGLPRSAIRVPEQRMATTCCGQPVAAPLGVAAGPHTQLAPNIVASWLCGARFLELKTVQVLDDISVSRPCIDAADVTFNCEWSQELSLDQSFEEYAKAWVLIHALAGELGTSPGVMFNMSVGYDLEGIRTDKVQRFIRRMRDAREELPSFVDALAAVVPKVRDVSIPSTLSTLVTLSTMHGCPPSEIERIARFMLEDLGLDTWVKLNPTLLGPELLRGILHDRMGFDIVVDDAAFEHDPKFDEAMQMVRSLSQVAKSCGRSFGLKLSNTLEVSNHRPVFPSTEKSMYMSGRALHPLTVTLAHRVTEALDGLVPISFCGGAHAFNFPMLVADGLGPVTTCTDLLEPGGYARLAQYLDGLAEAMDECGAGDLDAFTQCRAQEPDGMGVPAAARENLARHAEEVLGDRALRQRIKPLQTKGQRALGLFDCIAAPCQEACPTHQNIPDYLRLVALERPEDALEVILHTNAMPAITGRVCDHPCIDRCVRNHYEAPLSIRAIKRHAVSQATASARAEALTTRGMRVAVVGAGPAGLSAAYYLARSACSVTVFEAKTEPGGMTSAVIPSYRLPEAPILQDIERIKQAGVHVRCGVRIGKDITLGQLRSEGYDHVVLAAGAQKGRKLGILGEEADGVYDALELLDAVRHGQTPAVGPKVLVIGGGNSAMDAARTAVRLAGPHGSVTVVYRRTMSQMPADPDEIEAAQDEGVTIEELRAPVKVVQCDGKVSELVCSRMALGEVDASGRPRPVPLEGSEVPISCDTIIVGISQQPVLEFLGGLEPEMYKDGTLKVDPDTGETSVPNVYAGGDLARGPSTVVWAVADGRRIARTIAQRENLRLEADPKGVETRSRSDLLELRSTRQRPVREAQIPLERRDGFEEVLGGLSAQQAVIEAQRCLSCGTMCSLCVTVCPNRANQMIEVDPVRAELPWLVVQDGEIAVGGTRAFAVTQRYQIVHIADFCNECGNCTTFCPTAGAPFRNKPRVHLDERAFLAAEGDAYRFVRDGEQEQLLARIGGAEHRWTSQGDRGHYEGQGVSVTFSLPSLSMVEAEARSDLPDGTEIDLSVAATMMIVAQARGTVPSG